MGASASSEWARDTTKAAARHDRGFPDAGADALGGELGVGDYPYNSMDPYGGGHGPHSFRVRRRARSRGGRRRTGLAGGDRGGGGGGARQRRRPFNYRLDARRFGRLGGGGGGDGGGRRGGPLGLRRGRLLTLYSGVSAMRHKNSNTLSALLFDTRAPLVTPEQENIDQLFHLAYLDACHRSLVAQDVSRAFTANEEFQSILDVRHASLYQESQAALAEAIERRYHDILSFAQAVIDAEDHQVASFAAERNDEPFLSESLQQRQQTHYDGGAGAGSGGGGGGAPSERSFVSGFGASTAGAAHNGAINELLQQRLAEAWMHYTVPALGRVVVWNGFFFCFWHSAVGEQFGRKEHRATRWVLECHVPHLHVPSCYHVRYKGRGVTVMSLIPISENVTAVTDQNVEVAAMAQQVASAFSLLPYMSATARTDGAFDEATLHYIPRNVQPHLGRDGRYYFIQNRNWLPRWISSRRPFDDYSQRLSTVTPRLLARRRVSLSCRAFAPDAFMGESKGAIEFMKEEINNGLSELLREERDSETRRGARRAKRAAALTLATREATCRAREGDDEAHREAGTGTFSIPVFTPVTSTVSSVDNPLSVGTTAASAGRRDCGHGSAGTTCTAAQSDGDQALSHAAMMELLCGSSDSPATSDDDEDGSRGGGPANPGGLLSAPRPSPPRGGILRRFDRAGYPKNFMGALLTTLMCFPAPPLGYVREVKREILFRGLKAFILEYMYQLRFGVQESLARLPAIGPGNTTFDMPVGAVWGDDSTPVAAKGDDDMFWVDEGEWSVASSSLFSWDRDGVLGGLGWAGSSVTGSASSDTGEATVATTSEGSGNAKRREASGRQRKRARTQARKGDTPATAAGGVAEGAEGFGAKARRFLWLFMGRPQPSEDEKGQQRPTEEPSLPGAVAATGSRSSMGDSTTTTSLPVAGEDGADARPTPAEGGALHRLLRRIRGRPRHAPEDATPAKNPLNRGDGASGTTLNTAAAATASAADGGMADGGGGGGDGGEDGTRSRPQHGSASRQSTTNLKQQQPKKRGGAHGDVAGYSAASSFGASATAASLSFTPSLSNAPGTHASTNSRWPDFATVVERVLVAFMQYDGTRCPETVYTRQATRSRSSREQQATPLSVQPTGASFASPMNESAKPPTGDEAGGEEDEEEEGPCADEGRILEESEVLNKSYAGVVLPRIYRKFRLTPRLVNLHAPLEEEDKQIVYERLCRALGVRVANGHVVESVPTVKDFTPKTIVRTPSPSFPCSSSSSPYAALAGAVGLGAPLPSRDVFRTPQSVHHHQGTQQRRGDDHRAQEAAEVVCYPMPRWVQLRLRVLAARLVMPCLAGEVVHQQEWELHGAALVPFLGVRWYLPGTVDTARAFMERAASLVISHVALMPTASALLYHALEQECYECYFEAGIAAASREGAHADRLRAVASVNAEEGVADEQHGISIFNGALGALRVEGNGLELAIQLRKNNARTEGDKAVVLSLLRLQGQMLDRMISTLASADDDDGTALSSSQNASSSTTTQSTHTLEALRQTALAASASGLCKKGGAEASATQRRRLIASLLEKRAHCAVDSGVLADLLLTDYKNHFSQQYRRVTAELVACRPAICAVYSAEENHGGGGVHGASQRDLGLSFPGAEFAGSATLNSSRESTMSVSAARSRQQGDATPDCDRGGDSSVNKETSVGTAHDGTATAAVAAGPSHPRTPRHVDVGSRLGLNLSGSDTSTQTDGLARFLTESSAVRHMLRQLEKYCPQDLLLAQDYLQQGVVLAHAQQRQLLAFQQQQEQQQQQPSQLLDSHGHSPLPNKSSCSSSGATNLSVTSLRSDKEEVVRRFASAYNIFSTVEGRCSPRALRALANLAVYRYASGDYAEWHETLQQLRASWRDGGPEDIKQLLISTYSDFLASRLTNSVGSFAAAAGTSASFSFRLGTGPGGGNASLPISRQQQQQQQQQRSYGNASVSLPHSLRGANHRGVYGSGPGNGGAGAPRSGGSLSFPTLTALSGSVLGASVPFFAGTTALHTGPAVRFVRVEHSE